MSEFEVSGGAEIFFLEDMRKVLRGFVSSEIEKASEPQIPSTPRHLRAVTPDYDLNEGYVEDLQF